MKTLALGTAALGIWLAIGSHSDGTSLLTSRVATERLSDHPSNYELTDVVQQYCVRCHNEQRLTGNLPWEFRQYVSSSGAFYYPVRGLLEGRN